MLLLTGLVMRHILGLTVLHQLIVLILIVVVML